MKFKVEYLIKQEQDMKTSTAYIPVGLYIKKLKVPTQIRNLRISNEENK